MTRNEFIHRMIATWCAQLPPEEDIARGPLIGEAVRLASQVEKTAPFDADATELEGRIYALQMDLLELNTVIAATNAELKAAVVNLQAAMRPAGHRG
jgi:hypothetical protein